MIGGMDLSSNHYSHHTHTHPHTPQITEDLAKLGVSEDLTPVITNAITARRHIARAAATRDTVHVCTYTHRHNVHTHIDTCTHIQPYYIYVCTNTHRHNVHTHIDTCTHLQPYSIDNNTIQKHTHAQTHISAYSTY